MGIVATDGENYDNADDSRSDPEPRPTVEAMPIHFYCVYCNKQLGIATRKAGHIVTCPNCQKQIRVPAPEESTEAKITEPSPIEQPPARSTTNPPKPSNPNIFENSNFADVLQAAPLPSAPAPVAAAAPAPAPVAAPLPPTFDLPKPEPAAPLPAVRLAQSAPVAAPLPAKPGLYLSPTRATAILVLFVFLIAGAFISGLIVGRILAGE